MAAITISNNFKWQKKNESAKKKSMKFRSQIENQVNDYRLLRTSSLYPILPI
jgi:hypothetical protein